MPLIERNWLPCSVCGRGTPRLCAFHHVPVCGRCQCRDCYDNMRVRVAIITLLVVALVVYFFYTKRSGL